jgi:hypothetical protein
MQLQAIGKSLRPGQRVRLLYLYGDAVQAWDMPKKPDIRTIDKARYYELAVRAASAVFHPMGLTENELRAWLKGGIQLTFDFALPKGKRPILLPPANEESAWQVLFQPNSKKIPLDLYH